MAQALTFDQDVLTDTDGTAKLLHIPAATGSDINQMALHWRKQRSLYSHRKADQISHQRLTRLYRASHRQWRNMNNVITLCPIKNEARVDTRVLAERLQNQHKNVLALVEQYQGDFEELGILAFQTRKSKRGMPERFALLNEDQSYLLLAFSKNTKHVRGLKVELVKAFSRFRQHRQIEVDYLPFYHELHDEVKVLADRAHRDGSAAPERTFHINFNRLINNTFGLESGQRPNLPACLRAKVTAANVIAKELLEEAITKGYDHKAAYLHVKNGILAFADVGVNRLEVLL